MSKKSKPKNMSLGALADPTTILARKFRWVLESDSFKSYVVQSLNIDHVAKQLHITFRDVIVAGKGLDALRWIKSLGDPKQKLKFISLDGCGQELYSITFSGFELKSHVTEHDYNDNGEVGRKVLISYTKESIKYNFPASGAEEK